ncbi:MAG TPA: HNH endonuclease [Planctomycetota bacterium]|nr:HNH endonuclease [Planctomycetota bacterium]
MSKAALKLAVLKRANGCCEYCKSQVKYSSDSFSIEHIVSCKRHGSDAFSNLAFACQGCNNHKHACTVAIDPLSGASVRLFHPRNQHWNEHFTWTDDYSIVVGITAVGRATVARLKLNRSGLINQRKALASIGKHPA